MVAAMHRRRLVRIAAWLVAVGVVYSALGFFAAPLILRRLIVRRGGSALHREVTLDRVRVNPFALSVAVVGLSVRDRDGGPFVSWDELYVRLAPLRIFSGDVGLAVIRLVRPSIRAGLSADGSLSFQDLLETSEPASPSNEETGGGLGLSIGQLSVEEARIAFHDETRQPAFERALGPLTIRLQSFRTRGGAESPYSFSGQTDLGEAFRWTGTVGTRPIRSTGTLSFQQIDLPRYGPYVRDAAPIAIRSGLLDLEVRYDLEWGPTAHRVRLTNGKVAIRDLAAGPAGATDPPLKLRSIEVSGVEVDPLARVTEVAEVTFSGGSVRVLREQNGSLELMGLAPPSGPRDGRATPSSPWDWSVGTVAISGLALDLEDRAPQSPVKLALAEVALRLEKLRPAAEASWPLSLSLSWPGGGKLAVTGSVRPFASRAALDIEASELDLVPLAPYLRPGFSAQLAGGLASLKARVEVDASREETGWTVAGDVRLDRLSVAESGNPDLFRWQALEVNGLAASSRPPRVAVRQVRLVEPRAKIYRFEDGTTSLSRARGSSPPARPGPPPERPAPPGGSWETRLGTFELVNGRATFVDRSISPPAVLDIARATAKIVNLSSDPKVRSTADLRLQVAGASPIQIKGTLNPLQASAYTDLAVTSQGVDLTPLDPYVGKYLGYQLRKGKLDLDLRYEVKSRKLTSTNVIRVNQFTLGESTHSPDAVHVPVRLALALLQDADGVILIDVPVEGNLDDPEFRLGKLIGHAILNVLAKVATSPFRALAALAGAGNRELSVLEFAPGSPELGPEARDRVTALARSLAKRPALGLEVQGSADEDRDGLALRRASLERSLRSAGSGQQAPASDEAPLSADERASLLRTAYAAAFPAPPTPTGGEESAAAPPPTEPSLQEMEARLLASEQIGADALASLAEERAERARDALIEAGVDQERLFLTQGGERAAREKGARVYFEVR